MSDSTDASLLRRLRTNEDREAWDRFVGLYTPLVRRWAVRLQATGSDVDELTQEVLTALVRALPEFRYDAAGRFRGWLWTITKNKRRELLRHRTPAGLSDADLDNLAVDDPVEAVDASEYRNYLVGRALILMQDEFQTTTWRAFLETAMHSRTASDVARELGLTVDAVYAAKSRVLRRLRQELEGLTEWE